MADIVVSMITSLPGHSTEIWCDCKFTLPCTVCVYGVDYTAYELYTSIVFMYSHLGGGGGWGGVHRKKEGKRGQIIIILAGII